jgi:Fe2+ or Zn2+ uptake regulation protein
MIICSKPIIASTKSVQVLTIIRTHLHFLQKTKRSVSYDNFKFETQQDSRTRQGKQVMSTDADNKAPAKKTAKGFSLKEMEIRFIKNFLDILILIEMKKHSNLSGYDITAFVNNKFGGVLSPGTVYAALYAMERKGLIEGESDGRKTVYKLTSEGEAISQMMGDFKGQMIEFMQRFMTV